MKRSDVKRLKYLSTWIYIHISYWTYNIDAFTFNILTLSSWVYWVHHGASSRVPRSYHVRSGPVSLSQDDPRKHECRGKMNQGEVRQWTRSSAVWWSCNTTKSPISTYINLNRCVPNAFVSNVKVSLESCSTVIQKDSPLQHPLAGILHMGVSKNRGTPKWMVYIMEHPTKMDDLGVPPF